MAYLGSLDERIKKMEELVGKVTDSGMADRDYDVRMVRVQWRNVSLVMDRAFFVFYVILIIITTSIYFPRPQ